MSIAEKLTTVAENQQKVYDAGQQAEYDRFWDEFQKYGNQRNYQDHFRGKGWKDSTYNPKYPIICEGSNYAAYVTFNGSAITTTKVPIEIRCDIAQAMFSGCSSLKTIPYLGIFGATDLGSMFTACTNLENITIDGEIGVEISFSVCSKLTNESVQSIIDHLADLTGQTSKKVSFHSSVLDRLTDAQINAISAKNWTF